MKIGIIFGGKGAEEFYNQQAVIEIERVFTHYKIDSRRIYLNQKNLTTKDLKDIQIFFTIDSNCQNYDVRQEIYKYIEEESLPSIGQNQHSFKLARNKFESNQLFTSSGLLAPKSSLFKSDNFSTLESLLIKVNFAIKHLIKLPLIVKDNLGSSSENVFFCDNHRQFVESIICLYNQGLEILIEEYITGKELTVPFVQLFGKKLVLNPIQLICKGPIYNYHLKNKNFKAKIVVPPSHINQSIINSVKEITRQANKLIGCSYYSRLDFKLRDKNPYIIEINGEPTLCVNDFITKSACSLSLSYSKLIIGLLSNSHTFVEYANKNNPKLFKFIINSQKKVADLAIKKY